MKIKVIHSARKPASEPGLGLKAVVHKLLTVYTQAKKIFTIYPQIYPHPPIDLQARGIVHRTAAQKFYYFCGMHSSFSPLSRWRVHPLIP